MVNKTDTEQLRAEFEALERKRKGFGGDTLTRASYETNDEYLLPLVQARWEGYQAGRDTLQSQDAERLDWIEAKQGCEIIEFADGTWAVNIPVGPFGIGNNMREAIDYARLVEKGGGMNTKTPYQEGAEARRSGATWFACPYTDFYRRRQWFLGWDSSCRVEGEEE